MRSGGVRALGALAGALFASAATAEPHHDVRIDLGIGAPTGAAGLRYRLDPDVSTGTSLAVGVGFAYSGLDLSLAAEQPLHELGGAARARPARLLAYGGYSVGILRRTPHLPFAARDNRFVPAGNYHWLDLGVMIEERVDRVVFVGGLGMSVLLHAPDLPAIAPDDDASFVTPEWWFAKGVAPSLWAGVGWHLE